jgi:lysophospholipase L1-like esterase
VQNILWRLENGELDGVHPKVIVLMAGTNNLNGPPGTDPEAKVEETTRGIEAILSIMRQKAPEAHIILMGITPREYRSALTDPKVIESINERISRLADGRKIRYLNINRQLADSTGKPLPGMTVDGLHFTAKAYQVWADAVKPILTELLGPPAQTDQAPPATGDPSPEQKANSR